MSQLRYLQTLNSISVENNSTIVFPVPVDILSSFWPQQVQYIKCNIITLTVQSTESRFHYNRYRIQPRISLQFQCIQNTVVQNRYLKHRIQYHNRHSIYCIYSTQNTILLQVQKIKESFTSGQVQYIDQNFIKGPVQRKLQCITGTLHRIQQCNRYNICSALSTIL